MHSSLRFNFFHYVCALCVDDHIYTFRTYFIAVCMQLSWNSSYQIRYSLKRMNETKMSDSHSQFVRFKFGIREMIFFWQANRGEARRHFVSKLIFMKKMTNASTVAIFMQSFCSLFIFFLVSPKTKTVLKAVKCKHIFADGNSAFLSVLFLESIQN